MLSIYKASAGSGKTFRLVLEYLKLVLANENNYRQILAVTFTNKATAEMKERVIGQLYNLANNIENPYSENLIRETGLDTETITKRSGKVLENILFDFNRFSVSTIDKFTQKVIKSFNREIGVTPNYQVELDNQLIIKEAVDRIITTITSNKALRNWLEDFIDEKIRNNKNFAVENDLISLGQELFKEKFQENIEDLNRFFSDPSNTSQYLKTLNSCIFPFEHEIKNRASSIMGTYKAAGFSNTDFTYRNSGIAGFIEKIAAGNVPDELGARVLEAEENPEKWVAKTHASRQEILALVTSGLQPQLKQMLEYYRSHKKDYYTAKAIKREWYTMAVLIDLNNEITALNREKEVLPLASSNLLLRSIIDGNETPFIYEKSGNAYGHFMLDEFQDTSSMQWDNFKPLIANSLGLGKENLVVGDIKQSIYRWRNSSWDILANQITRDFQYMGINNVNLNANYRSDARIISFNNHFFQTFSNKLAAHEQLVNATENYPEQLREIYSDVQQVEAPQTAQAGYVRIDILEDEDEGFRDNSLANLEKQIKFLQDQGLQAHEIAILVRKNDEGKAIVGHFLQLQRLEENQTYNLKIVSSESLFLESSDSVNFIINVLRFYFNKENRIVQSTLIQLYSLLQTFAGQESLSDIELSGLQSAIYPTIHFEEEFTNLLLPKLNALEPELQNSSIDEIIIRVASAFGLFRYPFEIPFLQALMDKAADLRKRYLNDISGFLNWWDEKGYKESVKVNENMDAMRLMTIHKSKGLEFKAVLIPFFNWPLFDFKNNILWCTPEMPPFNKAPLVPVSFNKDLENTIFSKDYFRETFNGIIDNLNLIYVAFTRARSVLMVNAPGKPKKDTVCTLLSDTLSDLSGNETFVNCWDAKNTVFKYGSIDLPDRSVKQNTASPTSGWTFNSFTAKLKLTSTSKDFDDVAEFGATSRDTGNLIHQIMSRVKTKDELDEAIIQIALEKRLADSDKEQIRNTLHDLMQNPKAVHWFDGSYKVMNEKQILSPKGLYRPDRIMIRDKEAVIIDFKTGSLRPESYRNQVRKYGNLLLQAGYEKVDGYLWYVHGNNLERVEIL